MAAATVLTEKENDALEALYAAFAAKVQAGQVTIMTAAGAHVGGARLFAGLITDADMKRLEAHFAASKARACFNKEYNPAPGWEGMIPYMACTKPDVLREHAVRLDPAAVFPAWFDAAYPARANAA